MGGSNDKVAVSNNEQEVVGSKNRSCYNCYDSKIAKSSELADDFFYISKVSLLNDYLNNELYLVDFLSDEYFLSKLSNTKELDFFYHSNLKTSKLKKNLP